MKPDTVRELMAVLVCKPPRYAAFGDGRWDLQNRQRFGMHFQTVPIVPMNEMRFFRHFLTKQVPGQSAQKGGIHPYQRHSRNNVNSAQKAGIQEG